MVRGIEVGPDFVDEVDAIRLEDVVGADRQIHFLDEDARRHRPSVGRGRAIPTAPGVPLESAKRHLIA